jgi:hypothetical protein
LCPTEPGVDILDFDDRCYACAIREPCVDI